MVEDPRVDEIYARWEERQARWEERQAAREVERAELVLRVASMAAGVAAGVEPGPARVAAFARMLESLLPGQESLRLLVAALFVGSDGVA